MPSDVQPCRIIYLRVTLAPTRRVTRNAQNLAALERLVA
jgi:hypothetical protein